MNDVSAGHELLGKVVVITEMDRLPENCKSCPYWDEKDSFSGYPRCEATQLINGEDITDYPISFDDVDCVNECAHNCPLRQEKLQCGVGEVVVMTNISDLPENCKDCPCYGKMIPSCVASCKLRFLDNLDYIHNRADFCPLRIVGR